MIDASAGILLNRPLLESDLDQIGKNPHAVALRRMVAEYAALGLPVMNGSFLYSNLVEGPMQQLTCSPFRLWEYSSLFDVWRRTPGANVLDIGGAASPLPYLLAERGAHVTATDLQPLLVEVANHVARQRKIPLEAVCRDVANPPPEWDGAFDLVTSISVLEHIPPEARFLIFQAIYRILRPGGLFYMTFDYGSFQERTTYRGEDQERSQAIDDIAPLADQMERAGLRFVENDPRGLSSAVLALQRTPGDLRNLAMWQRQLIGVVDAETRWRTLAGYVLRRVLHRRPPEMETRFHHHNFFRVFLEKPSSAVPGA